MTQNDRDFLALLQRSPDRGDGWRSVSRAAWQFVERCTVPELLEIDSENNRVRLTRDGKVVVKYL